jgi:hypothetical protein
MIASVLDDFRILLGLFKQINPKHEFRNSKQIQMTKILMTETKVLPN